MTDCDHHDSKKHGYDRYGQPRRICRQCGRTWVVREQDTVFGESRGKWMNRISVERERLLAKLLAQGASAREIRRQTGCHSTTVLRRKKVAAAEGPPPKTDKPNACDNCGREFAGKREYHRRTRRTKHKFCDHVCFCEWMRDKRASDRCKRCQRTRREIGICALFSLGYCNRCYGILRQFNFDEKAADLYELNVQLKKAISQKSVEETNRGRRSNSKHRRPQEDAD